MSDIPADLRREYAAGLRRHVRRPDEKTLESAYDLGRRALRAGLGVLEMAHLHHQALGDVRPGAGRARSGPGSRGAQAFFLESLTPFEMTHRAFREAAEALRRMNERVEDEAKRIAHALHDEAGSLLASVHIALEDLARDLPPGKRRGLRKARELLDQIEKELRQLSHELRPTVLDDLGLLPALDFLSKGVAKRTGLSIAVEGSSAGRLPPAIETTLYRNVQEALNNVVRHAEARRVTVRVARKGRGVRCAVADDGVGFDPSNGSPKGRPRGIGLIGLRERLGSLNGTLRITSAPGRGTEILMSIPLEE